MHVLRIVFISFFIVVISFSSIGGCGGGGDNDDGSGSDNDQSVNEDIRTCDEFVNALCNRADECGLNPPGMCPFDFLLEDLETECDNFVVKSFPDQCINDLDNFSCLELSELEIPQSCGDKLFIPEIQLPDGPCKDFIEVGCDRMVECDDSILFDECVFASLFVFEVGVGGDCSNVAAGPTFNQCLEDLSEFECSLIDEDIPPSCQSVLIGNPPVGLCGVCDTDADCAEGLICSECIGDCTGAPSRCTDLFIPFTCEDGIFRTEQ